MNKGISIFLLLFCIFSAAASEKKSNSAQKKDDVVSISIQEVDPRRNWQCVNTIRATISLSSTLKGFKDNLNKNRNFPIEKIARSEAGLCGLTTAYPTINENMSLKDFREKYGEDAQLVALLEVDLF